MQPQGYYPPPPPPRRSSTSTTLIILACVFGGLMVFGILAAIAIPSFLDYQKKAKAKRSEAELNLDYMQKALKARFVEYAGFPVGDSGVTPDVSCCDDPTRKCQPENDAWNGNPIWDELDFSVDEPHYYRYQYSSADGQSFVAKAIGDLDCDDSDVEYTLEGTIGPDGSPQFVLTKPTRAD